ncbi:MAG TPA: hypothetical protein VN372_02085 [Methanospirillum sp.]|nr:hypothetical protein [Methanospirillum sp.]
MSFIDKVKHSLSGAAEDAPIPPRPDFVNEVLVVEEELEKYQNLLANVEKSFSDGQIDQEDYAMLKSDHETKITSLKAKIMSRSREYLDLKNELTDELTAMRTEKAEAEGKLEKVEKHYSLQLITEEDYNAKKSGLIAIIKRTTTIIEKKQSFYDEIIVISPYIEEK